MVTFELGETYSKRAIQIGVLEFSGSVPGMTLSIVVSGGQPFLMAEGTPTKIGTYVISTVSPTGTESSVTVEVIGGTTSCYVYGVCGTSTEEGHVGHVTPDPDVVASGGSSTIFVETTDEAKSVGYTVSNIVVTRGSSSQSISTYNGQTDFSFTVSNITTTVEVTVYWSANAYSVIEGNIRGRGSMSGAGTYPPGQTVTVIFSANSGNHIKQIRYGKTSAMEHEYTPSDLTTRTWSYVIRNIDSDWVFAGDFEVDSDDPDEYTLRVRSSFGCAGYIENITQGTGINNESTAYNPGDRIRFTVRISEGYSFVAWRWSTESDYYSTSQTMELTATEAMDGKTMQVVSSGSGPEPPGPEPEPTEDEDPYGGSSITTGAKNCYLKRTYNGKTSVFYLPFIQSIEEDDDAQLSEISTIVMGFDNNFVMDLGTTQKFTLTLRRPQPRNVLDSATGDQARWSNGFWYTQLRKFIDRWQNLYTENDGTKTGGLTFYFTPASDPYTGTSAADLFPTITRNVFVSGQLSARNAPGNLQELNLSVPLTVASMVDTDADVDMVTITLREGEVGTKTETRQFMKGVSGYVPNMPDAWAKDAEEASIPKAFNFWTSGTTIYRPGDVFTPTEGMVLTAEWISPVEWKWHSHESVVVWNVPTNATIMYYWLVGPGGNGGKARTQSLRPSTSRTTIGGGGGAGAYISGSVGVTAGEEVTFAMTHEETRISISRSTGTMSRVAVKGNDGTDAGLGRNGIGGAGAADGHTDTSDGGTVSQVPDYHEDYQNWLHESNGGSQGNLVNRFAGISVFPSGGFTSKGGSYPNPGNFGDYVEPTYGGGGASGTSLEGREGALGLIVIAFDKGW